MLIEQQVLGPEATFLGSVEAARHTEIDTCVNLISKNDLLALVGVSVVDAYLGKYEVLVVLVGRIDRVGSRDSLTCVGVHLLHHLLHLLVQGFERIFLIVVKQFENIILCCANHARFLLSRFRVLSVLFGKQALGAYAEQDVVSLGILLVDVVDVVGGDHLDAKLL